jgi:hypothetical protein
VDRTVSTGLLRRENSRINVHADIAKLVKPDAKYDRLSFSIEFSAPHPDSNKRLGITAGAG